MVFETVQKLIAEQLEIDPSTITLESNLVTDLKADSVDVMEVVMNLESEYDMEFAFEKLSEIKTVGDVVAYIEANQ